MAAVTVNRRRSSVWGQYKALLLDITVANSGDTYASPFHLIENVSYDAASGAGTMGLITKSGGTITFNTSGGSTRGLLQVIGV